MSSKSEFHPGSRTRTAYGPIVMIAAVVLLIAAGAWITLYTRSLETTKPQAAQNIDPVTTHLPAAGSTSH